MAEGPSPVVLHIASADDWSAAAEEGVYRPPSLAVEGFVHCSLPSQVAGTLSTWFAGRGDLVLLTLDAAALGERLVMEAGARGESERFPHLYGPVPLDAVIGVEPVIPG